jgi:hypothetical protein
MAGQQTTNALRRPQWHRWVFAAIAAWLIAPLAMQPMLWNSLTSDLLLRPLFELPILYLMHLLYASVHMVFLIIFSFALFNQMASLSWWVWGLIGGIIGLWFVIMPPILAWWGYVVTFPNSTVISAFVSGFISTIIYRSILMTGARQI